MQIKSILLIHGKKVSLINDLNCDIFIDDLIEVLDHDNLDKNIRRIHLSSNNSSKMQVFQTGMKSKKYFQK